MAEFKTFNEMVESGEYIQKVGTVRIGVGHKVHWGIKTVEVATNKTKDIQVGYCPAAQTAGYRKVRVHSWFPKGTTEVTCDHCKKFRF